MKRIRYTIIQSLLLLCCTVLLLGACKDDDEPARKRGKAQTTLVIYMAAENSLYKYVTDDLREMALAAPKVSADCNVVVYLDDLDAPRLYTATAKGGFAEYRRLSERNSADATVFEQTMKEITGEFPAEHYNLVMWSHGSGWVMQKHEGKRHNTIAIDNSDNTGSNTGTEMNISEMRQALEKLGLHWDCILFDACHMQCVESDYELRNLTDYIIASPAEIPGEGAPYQLVIPYLIAGKGTVEGVTESYFRYYENSDGLLLSVVKTSELENLLRVTQQVCPDFYTQAFSFPTDDIQRYGSFSARPKWRPEYHDMGSAMYRMLDAAAYNTWRAQLERTVCIRKFTNFWFSELTPYVDPLNPSKRLLEPVISDPDHVAIIAMFIPNSRYDERTSMNEDIKQTLWYRDFTSKDE